MMEKRILIPDTDLSVYPIGLGCADIGLKADAVGPEKVFDTYLDLGGNLIDTAHVYSNWVPGERARSERIIGDWLKGSGKRNQIILMTKGGHPEIVEGAPEWGKIRPTHEAMVSDLEHSLKQLRTDYIDIYFYHRDNRNQTIEEEIETMEGFVKEGKIRYYACSNFDTDRMLAAYEYCKSKGYRGFVADQCLMNLAMKYMNEPADPTLRCIRGDNFDYHVDHPELMAMPFFGNCAGYFHKYLVKGSDAVKDMYYDTEKNRKVAENVKKLTERYECSITQAVMGFFRFQPFTCIPLYGTSSPEHIMDACKTLDVPFSENDYEEVLDVQIKRYSM